MPEIYCKPVYTLGTGLGNRLFAWARCVVFARRYGATMIDPIWFRPAVGQLFRGGIDYRCYFRQLALFRLFRSNPANLRPLSGFIKSYGGDSIDEVAALELASTGRDASMRKALVVFIDHTGFFAPLNGRHSLLLRELRAVTRDKYLRLTDSVGEVPVGICVRCGNDYREPSNDRYEPLGHADKTPLKWFVATLELIRREVGRPVRAVVVSDGTKEHLKPLLELENVTFVRPGAAISDLLVLSRAKVLLAPGASSFAAWASFFGRMPSASHPGQPLSVWGMESPAGVFTGELNPTNPAKEFLRQAAEALAGAAV
jgi:hypothetical protein